MNAGFSAMARRWGLLVAGAVLVTSLFPALAPAQSNSAGVPVTGGSWYWQEQVGTVEPGGGLPPVAPPGALPTPDVPAGDFPVSVVAAQPDKETFLQLDTSAIAAGSTVSSLVLTLHEDATGGNVAADTAKIEARAVTSFFAAGDSGKPWAGRPAYDTTGPAVAGKRAADGTWTFELAPIAQAWANGAPANSGLALVPAAPEGSQGYEVVWVGVGKDKGPTTSGSVSPPSPASTGGDTSAQASSGDSSSAAPLSIAPDTSGAGVATSDTPSIAPGSSTPAAAAPRLSTPAAAPPRVRQISSTHRAPPWSFYLAIVAALALIGASTLSLGELGEPEPDRRGGVLRALERRGQEVET
ncbi:MAG: hypothetical protein JWP02_3851 [Acidimicrobiales bacterium]|nr:hypothetical protein [Acidimicrobiales bacterium]